MPTQVLPSSPPPLSTAMSDEPTPPMRVAIVGGGPRGLYCLESLANAITASAVCRPVHVTLFEPTSTPGAGNVYAPDQPRYLRMNFAVKHINAWSPDRTGDQRPSLLMWLQQRYPRWADPDATLPRAVVGRYLEDCFDRVLEGLPGGMSVEIRRQSVRALRRRSNQWWVCSEDEPRPYDEVVMTVGHQGWRRGRAMVYPVDRQLSPLRVPAGANVTIRGFALTWIDATLALTEGRGGRFLRSANGFIYQPSGWEPAAIVPHSRSMRPMLAKADDRELDASLHCRGLWSPLRREIEALEKPPQGFDFESQIWPLVLRAAAAALEHVSAPTSPVECPQRWFERYTAGRMTAAAAEQCMRQSYAIAIGNRQPDAGWALGEAWRQLYPAMVEQLSHGGLAVDSWPAFTQIAREMERIAFGPPAENLGRMLALLDAKILRLESTGDDASETIEIDAVLASPHQWPNDSPLSILMRDGWIRRQPGGQGVMVDRCGRPTRADGRTTPGLAVLGRVTEGCIIGNDTLSRTLHRHCAAWAHSLVNQLQRKPQTT